MIDHAQRLRTQQQQALENAAIEELEKRSAPLLWMVYAVTIVTVLSIAANQAASFADRYADMAAQNDVLVQCLNGHPISMGDAVLRCDVREYKLVAGLTQEAQP